MSCIGVEMREYMSECWDAMGCDGMRWVRDGFAIGL